MIAFNHVVPVLNLSVFNVRRAPALRLSRGKRRVTIGGRFIRADESRILPLHVVEDFTQKPVCSFAVTTGGEIKKSTVRPRLSTARYRYAQRPLTFTQVSSMCHGQRSEGLRQYQRSRFSISRRITLNPAVNRGVIDIHSAFSQHLLQLTVTGCRICSTSVRPTE